MNVNEQIGRAVAEKLGKCIHIFVPKPAECENCDSGRHLEKIMWSPFNYDTDHNAIAHARSVLLDTDEKRARFYGELIILAEVPYSSRLPGMSFKRLKAVAEASPADQCKALIGSGACEVKG